jgi:hypothetical protein
VQSESKRSLSADDNQDRTTSLLRPTVRLFTKQRPELEKGAHNDRLEHLGKRLTQQQVVRTKYYLTAIMHFNLCLFLLSNHE